MRTVKYLPILPALIWFTCLNLAQSREPTQDKFRAQLELFAELGDRDSVVSITRIGTNVLEIEWRKAGDTATQKSRQSVPPVILEKFLSNARASDFRVETRMAEGGISAEEEDKPGSASTQKKNRFNYILDQSLFSSYAYGPALISAFDLDGNIGIATVLFTITGGITAHTLYGFRHSFEDAHITGLEYSAITSGAASYLVGMVAMGPNSEAFRLGSGLVLGAYPLSLWAGYRHADKEVNNPGRIGLEPAFTWPIGLAGYFLTGFYYGNEMGDNSETAFRVAAAQALGFGIAGHFASHLYRKGEHVPRGLPLGLTTHTFIGMMLGLSLAASVESDDPRLNVGLVLGPAVAGFGEGLWFFQARQDNWERAAYSILGMAGGAAFAGGILTLAETEASTSLWIVTSGIAVGYALTYSLLKGQIEKSAFHSKIQNEPISHIELNLLPIPEARKRTDGKWAMGYRVPGITLRF